MLVFFLFTGFLFTVKGNFFQFKNFIFIFKKFIKSFKRRPYNDANQSISQFSVFCSVLGACIGTGNIVGVAAGICTGGPGTVFWMIISAFLSMATAYAENYLGADFTSRYKGTARGTGAFLYISKGLKSKGLGKVYSVLCLFSSLGMGNMAQSNSLSEAMRISFNIPPIVTGIAASLIAFIILNGGVKRIARVQTLIIPLASVLYFLISFFILYKFRNNLLPSVAIIIKEAFSIKALNGFSVYTAMRYGISRGVFSNEAGLGSSTILHAQGETTDPQAQGISAMMEVFADTIVMCTVTALVILVSTAPADYTLFGAELSLKAYATAGAFGKTGVGLLTGIFAFTSLTSCSFYAETGFSYLLPKGNIKLFRIFYVALVLFACVNSPEIVWDFADICNGLMAVPNLFALNCLSKEVFFPKKEDFTDNKNPHRREHSSFLVHHLQ